MCEYGEFQSEFALSRTDERPHVLIAYWITATLLAFMYLLAGGMKLFTKKEKLEDMMAWSKNMNPVLFHLIGLVEVLGALGVILPPMFMIAPQLAPIAALGLVIVQAVAIGVHVRMKDVRSLPLNIILLVLALVVAWLGAACFPF